MRWSIVEIEKKLLVASVLLFACGDDAIAPYGVSEGGESGPVRIDATTGPLGEMSCHAHTHCEDGNACTVDLCIEGACTSRVEVTQTCRPTIELEAPARAAALQSDGPEVEVRGQVLTPASSDASLEINGEPVALDSSGRFSHTVEAHSGGNILVLRATDGFGQTRSRVQSFLWSPAYAKPTEFPDGAVDAGLTLYLDQESLDDGVRDLPPNDLNTLIATRLDAIDLRTLVGASPLASVGGYEIELTDLTRATTDSRLEAIDGGFQFQARLEDIQGDLLFRCEHSACDLTGGDGQGSFRLATMEITAQANLEIDEDHQLRAVITSIESDAQGLTLRSSVPWVDALLVLVAPVLESVLFPALESALREQVESLLSRELTDRLGSWQLDTPIAFPNPADPTTSTTAYLRGRLSAIDIHDGQWPPRPSPSQGAAFFLEAGVFGPDTSPSTDHPGVPLRYGCGNGDEPVDLPREGALEFGLSDDLVNQILYAAWRGGILDIPLVIPDLAGEARLNVHGLSAPTLSDCNEQGQPTLTIGDLQLDAEITLLGTRLTFRAFTSLQVAVGFEIAGDGVALRFGDISSMETEIVTHDDPSIEIEDLLLRTLESELEKTFLMSLGDGSALTIPLPTVGPSVLSPRLEGVDHRDGLTVMSAHF